MGIIRLFIIIIIGYFFYKLIKMVLVSGKTNSKVHGPSEKSSNFKNRKDIQDVDYEDLE